MTEREAWYAKLEAHPDDTGLRSIFADWLDEQGEPELAAGYRAIGWFGVVICTPRLDWRYGSLDALSDSRGTDHEGVRKKRASGALSYVTAEWYLACHRILWTDHEREITHREAEDAAALAWSKLTTAEQAEAARLLG